MSSYYDMISQIQKNGDSITLDQVESAGTDTQLFTESDWVGARDSIRTSQGRGTYEDSIARHYRSLTSFPGNNALPINRDHVGLTFFTRPNLNLSDLNLKRDRRLWSLRTPNPNSLQAVVRDYLDPVGARRRAQGAGGSSIVDERNPFICILTDNVTDISGFNDMEMQVYQGKPGLRQETVVMADGSVDMFQPFSVNSTFRNIIGNPIMFMHYIWLIYMAGVHNGELTPHYESLLQQEMDYWTRPYRLVLDPSGQYVRYIFAAGAMFPIGLPIGNMANYSIDKPFTQDNERITIQYQAVGNQAFDDILKDEFNRLVQMFYYTDYDRTQYNTRMHFPNDPNMQKLTPYERQLFNHRADMYPYIHPITSELQWFVRGEEYNELFQNLDKIALPPQYEKGIVTDITPQVDASASTLSSADLSVR